MMEKLQKHDVGREWLEFFMRDNVKTIVAVLAVELNLLLFVTYKGLGRVYLPITLMMMCFTVLCCGVAFYFEVDRYLLITVLVLLNVGFMVQALQYGENLKVVSFLLKFLVCIVGMVVGAAYKIWGKWVSNEKFLKLLMVVQILLCMTMLAGAELIGSADGDGAKISFFGVTMFEIVKIMYLFVAAGLLCKPEEEVFILWKLKFSREMVLIVHTFVLAVFFVLCKELGTLMVLMFTGAVLLWIYGKNKTLNTVLIGMGMIAFLAVWVVCDQILCPKVLSGELLLNDKIAQLIKRFGAALRPERYFQTAGYQGTLGLQAIAIGGILGIPTERYRLVFPEVSNDFIFVNVIQTSGLLMGVIVLSFFFAFMCRGVKVALDCKDTYFQGVAMAITALVMVETLVHVSYNLALFPITGIPCYFLSQGFMATATGLFIVSVMLVISAGNMRREA